MLRGVREYIKIPEIAQDEEIVTEAFRWAKRALPKGTGGAYDGDDYVSPAEFKFLMKYFRMFYEYRLAFNRIDKNSDKNITLEEFAAAQDTLLKWGIKLEHKDDPEYTFSKISKIEQGDCIRFPEFIDWAFRVKLDIPDDDD